MGHFRQRGRCAELAPVSRRNKTSPAVRHFVDIASQAARLMPCPPRLTPRRGDLSEGWGNLSEGLKWERPPVLGNSLHPDRITQARARNWRHAIHFEQTTRTLPPSRSRVQRACCTLRQRNRPETVRCGETGAVSPKFPSARPSIPRSGDIGARAGACDMPEEREKAAGARRQGHRS
jgi:hypothetical protein